MTAKKTLAGLAVGIAVVGVGSPVRADIRGNKSWHLTAWLLNTGTYSNHVGFWQNLMCSNPPSASLMGPVDGHFGSQTKSGTKRWQADPAAQRDGVVDSTTWRDTYDARAPGNVPRLDVAGSGFGRSRAHRTRP